MAKYSVPELLSLINQQMMFHETLIENLSKAEALAQVAMNSDDFLEYSASIIHSYLWTLTDVLEKSKQSSDASSKTLKTLARYLYSSADTSLITTT